MTVKSAWKRMVVGATGVAVAFALAACSAQPGVALNVNGTTYSEDEVSNAAMQLTELSGQPYSTAGVTYMLMLEPVMRDLAKANGIEFSEEDARNALAAVKEMTGEPASEAAVTVVRTSQLYSLLERTLPPEQLSQEITETLAALDLEVNPRYGELTEDNMLYQPKLDGVVQPQF
ncbi:MAG: hypothetical protein Q4E01_02575 [Actinomycetaceae bacterium]|nr:hypothetical protein [Actinomycetaceae bacterium]